MGALKITKNDSSPLLTLVSCFVSPPLPTPTVCAWPTLRWLQKTWNLETRLPTKYKMDTNAEVGNGHLQH